MAKKASGSFYLMVSICIIIGLGSFLTLYYQDAGFSNLAVSINNYTTTLRNNNSTTQIQKMIDWGLQRQLNWAVLLLTVITIYFTIFFYLHNMREDTALPKILGGMEILLSFCISIGAYMAIRSYYYVKYFENSLINNTSLTTSPLDEIIFPFTLILFLAFVVSAICLSKDW